MVDYAMQKKKKAEKELSTYETQIFVVRPSNVRRLATPAQKPTKANNITTKLYTRLLEHCFVHLSSVVKPSPVTNRRCYLSEGLNAYSVTYRGGRARASIGSRTMIYGVHRGVPGSA